MLMFQSSAQDNSQQFIQRSQKKHTWNVRAHPSGQLSIGSKQFPYLFWESVSNFDLDFTQGFIITPETAAEFLEDKLSLIGLNENEINDFITYWLPVLQKSRFNLVSFQFNNYCSTHPLTISPQPDSILRVFLAICPIQKRIHIEPQEIPHFNRTGFSVVEWGGTN